MKECNNTCYMYPMGTYCTDCKHYNWTKEQELEAHLLNTKEFRRHLLEKLQEIFEYVCDEVVSDEYDNLADHRLLKIKELIGDLL